LGLYGEGFNASKVLFLKGGNVMIIKMEDLGKIYSTGKIEVEALKNVNLDIS